MVGDLELPSFRGHIVNGDGPFAETRVPDPNRLVQAYHQSSSTLNLLQGVHEGRVRRPDPRPRVEPGVRRVEPRGPALRPPRRRDRSGDALHAGERHQRRQPEHEDGRRLHEPRSAHPRLRGGAHPPGLAHRQVVRLLGAHAVDRRTHASARRRAHRVPARRVEPDRVQGRADHRGRPRCSSSASRSTPAALPAGSR